MKSVLECAFSSAVTQSDKDAASTCETRWPEPTARIAQCCSTSSEMTTGKDRSGLAEMAFLIGMQAGYELGVAHPPPAETVLRILVVVFILEPTRAPLPAGQRYR